MICTIMDVILLLIQYSMFLVSFLFLLDRYFIALENSKILFSFRSHIHQQDTDFHLIKRFCSFLVTLSSQTAANMEKIKRQILFIDVFGLFLETANKATYDIPFLLSILELAKQLCCNSMIIICIFIL